MQRTAGFVASLVLGAVNGMGRSLPALGGAAALLMLAGHAAADIKAVEPYYVVVTKDNVPLKCSDGNIYYPVAKLKANQVLRVDGTGGGWLRAEYPSGTRAYVKADEGMYDDAAKTLKLTRPSKLMSANADGARPWWYLLDNDVVAGTVFANAQVVKSPDGTVEGYLIAAPAGARGYVREEATRAATADEAKGFMPVAAATPEPTPAPTPATVTTPRPSDTAAAPVAPVAPAVTPVAPATTASTPTPAPTTPTTSSAPATASTPAADTGSTITMSQTPAPGTTPTAPATTDASTANANAMPGTTISTPAPTPVVPTKRVDDAETLRNMFDRVMQGPGDETEIRTVISEFNRSINSLGNSDADTYKRRALESRLEALKLRQEVLDMRQRISETDRQFAQKTQQTTIAIQEVEKQAIYSIVGRIVPSTVYDGRRGLPMMYRVESADASSTRTIGYVVPREGVDLLTKMGKVVGIVGEAKMDPALGLNIVAPRRVDSLEIVGGKFQVVQETQSTSTTTSTGPNGTLTTTTTVITNGPANATTPQNQQTEPQSVPVAQPNEQPDMNK